MFKESANSIKDVQNAANVQMNRTQMDINTSHTAVQNTQNVKTEAQQKSTPKIVGV